jgi:hypothetical protein
MAAPVLRRMKIQNGKLDFVFSSTWNQPNEHEYLVKV